MDLYGLQDAIGFQWVQGLVNLLRWRQMITMMILWPHISESIMETLLHIKIYQLQESFTDFYTLTSLPSGKHEKKTIDSGKSPCLVGKIIHKYPSMRVCSIAKNLRSWTQPGPPAQLPGEAADGPIPQGVPMFFSAKTSKCHENCWTWQKMSEKKIPFFSPS